MKFRFGILAILFLFFVGVVLADYHADERNGDAALARGNTAARNKAASQNAARTSQRAANNAQHGADRAHHQGQADAHTAAATTHKATARANYQEAVSHYQNAKAGREAVRDQRHGGRDDAGHAQALQLVNQRLGQARNGVHQNSRRRR